jgi:uncharacterized membrane protein
MPTRYRMNGLTDYGFAMPSFFSGMGRALDVGAQFTEFNWSEDPDERDENSIFAAFRAVGVELMTACSRFERELGIRPDELVPLVGQRSTSMSGPLIVMPNYFRGLLPPTSVLEAYERIGPGSAERILVIAEGQRCSRHRMEHLSTRGALRSEMFGQWFAFLVVMAGMGLGAWLAYAGRDAAGALSTLTPLGTVAAIFLYSRGAQARERELKRYEMERARMGPPA